MLGRLLDKERRGQVQNLLDPSYVFANERDDIDYALLSIRQLINEFEDTTSDSVYKRVKSRLAHITSRVQRMPIDAENESYATCIELDAKLHERVLPSVAAVLPDPSQASTSTQQPILNVLNSQLSHSFRSVSISEWKENFDGGTKNLPRFLENVQELMQARQVSKAELFTSARDLFIGNGHYW
ncbi:hypothetical protein HHI36_017109 [Cryptolaemus montrouzieri]|uniref:Uncharacterized protein n=1 Tax=Cryptolaemus montrouzieri TaxID=559131 RepID=A0ABD2NLN9_9CUCU